MSGAPDAYEALILPESRADEEAVIWWVEYTVNGFSSTTEPMSWDDATAYVDELFVGVPDEVGVDYSIHQLPDPWGTD